jgi:hypothetical protein
LANSKIKLEYLKGTPLESFSSPERKEFSTDSKGYLEWIRTKEDYRKVIQKRSLARRKVTLESIEGLTKIMHHPDLIELKKVVLRHAELFSITTIHEICEKVDQVCGE